MRQLIFVSKSMASVVLATCIFEKTAEQDQRVIIKESEEDPEYKAKRNGNCAVNCYYSQCLS